MTGRCALWISAAATLVVLSAAVSAQAGFINGNFESGLAGWETSGTVSLVPSLTAERPSPGWPNSPDGNCARLDSGAVLWQTINVTPGVRYSPGFCAASNAPMDPPITSFVVTMSWVLAGGGTRVQSMPPWGTLEGDLSMLWSGYWAAIGLPGPWEITAPTDAQGLTFKFANNDTSSIDLDSITLTAAGVPEPSTWAALASLGVVGFFAYRRRQAAA